MCEFWKGLTKIREIMYFENEDCRIKEFVENGESTMGECKEMNCRERVEIENLKLGKIFIYIVKSCTKILTIC